MNKIYLLDCTLRDGGYVNNWEFGKEAIKGISQKICQTGVDIFEVGFLKGKDYNPDRSIFPDLKSVSNIINPKSNNTLYVGMIDMSDPIPIERITPYDGSSLDGIRVIFKKDKLELAFEYCKIIQELGYFISVNFVSTDLYTDLELIQSIKKFNALKPFAMSIVDTFGLIKRKQFLKMVYLADSNMDDGICLAYHAHNNLQQAFGNAEALVEMNLKRDIIIDACVFGMGRGAGNLNLELFAEYMNENFDTDYKIEPMLEIMDEYLNDIYKTKFWGYSIPLYLSASEGVHPNYAIYLAEKDSLTVKSFNEIVQAIPKESREKYSRDIAESSYRKYMDNFIDDRETIKFFEKQLSDRKLMILCPGKSLSENIENVKEYIKRNNCIVFATNFLASEFAPNYIFSSNMRRFSKIQNKSNAQCIITSNMKEATQSDYIINFSSYSSEYIDIIDNSALMLIRFLLACGVTEISIAGMDGYNANPDSSYYDDNLYYDFSTKALLRNELITDELNKLKNIININFITPTLYI